LGVNPVHIISYKVIGDKKGGRTSEILSDNSAKMSILEEISNVVQVPMKFIHVTRNPFDNIATIMLTSLGARKKVRGEEAKKVRELDPNLSATHPNHNHTKRIIPDHTSRKQTSKQHDTHD